MIRAGLSRIAVLCLTLAPAVAPGQALPAAPPVTRVVSLNLCTDQLLVLLAPEKVVGLTPLARDPALSFVADKASGLPMIRPDAEAILALHPDLVLAGPYGAQMTVALLEAQGLRVERVDLPQDFEGIRDQVRSVAALLGKSVRGEALIADLDRRLAPLPHPAHPPRALDWQARGFTAGPGTLGDAVMHAAGLANMSDGRHVGLEDLVAHPPDWLVVADDPAWPSLATDLLQHPATAGIPRRAVSPALMICAGPFTARAAEQMAGRVPLP